MIKYLEKLHGKLPIKNVYKKDENMCPSGDWLVN